MQVLPAQWRDQRAVGIVKFKRRKATALKKLEQERANLLRVSDILAELERQVEPLEKQSEVAKDYLKKKEELKTLDVNSFLLENASIKNQLTETTKVLKDTSDEFEQVSTRYENIKQEYEETLVKIEV